MNKKIKIMIDALAHLDCAYCPAAILCSSSLKKMNINEQTRYCSELITEWFENKNEN